jgi:hypothetical protein
MLRATKCQCADRLGLRPIVAANRAMPSGVRTVRTAPPGFLFVAEAVVLKFCAQFFYGVAISNHSVSHSYKVV